MLKNFLPKLMTATFLRYLVVGFLGTGIDFLILYTLVEFGHVHYLVAAIISVAIVLWISFSLNKYWTFGNFEKKYFKQLLKYLASHAVALAVNLVILVILVQVFHLWYLFAKVFATSVAAIVNFVIVKNFIFEKSKIQKSAVY